MIVNIDAKDFVPHEDGMLFVNKITDYIENVGGRVEAYIDEKCIFVDSNGILDNSLYVELMAQSFAAIEGYRASMQNTPLQMGFLVGVQNLEVHKGHVVTVGMTLGIETKLNTKVGAFSIVDSTVRHGNNILCSAQIKLYLADNNE